jgi:dUTP pyrophosphatase
MEIQIKKLSENAKLPIRGSEWAAGYDLFAAKDDVVFAQKRVLIPTDIALSIPSGYYGRIAPRSGLAYKHGIDVLAGVIDADYRGNLGVILYNTNIVEFRVNKGDRIAQLIIEKCHDVEWQETEELETSVRQDGGFGHTGK